MRFVDTLRDFRFPNMLVGGICIFSVCALGCRVPSAASLINPESEIRLSETEASQHPRSPRHRIAQSLRNSGRAQPVTIVDDRSQEDEVYGAMAAELVKPAGAEAEVLAQAESAPAPRTPDRTPSKEDEGGITFSLSDDEDVSTAEDSNEESPQRLASSLPPRVPQPRNRYTAPKTEIVGQRTRQRPAVETVSETLGESDPSVGVRESDESSVVMAGAVETTQEAAFADSVRGQTTPIAQRMEAPSGQSLDMLVQALTTRLRESYDATEDEQVRSDIAAKLSVLELLEGDLEGSGLRLAELRPEVQEYLRDTMQSLHAATDVESNPIEKQRLAAAVDAHRRATLSLSALATLKVNNLAFCTEVDSFGVVKTFPSYRFRAEDQVLLYCELENFVSRNTGEGFETCLQGSYEIVDASGRRVVDQLLPEDTDQCQNRRRDFYIAYRLNMPRDIEPGQYQMRLVIEDIHGKKFGQSEIDFEIVR